MKTIIKYLIIIFIILLSLVAIEYKVNFETKGSGEDLYIYNWGEYIDPDLIDQFEDEYNYNVIYETFDSNEAMLTKVKSNSSPYDIVFPSEYMVQKMIEEDLLLEIDHSKLSNYSNIDDSFLDNPFDPGNKYSIPYFWGTVGIVYDKTKTNLTFDSWDDLWDESLKNEVILTDGAREILGLSLNSQGFSLNTTNDLELTLAQEKLFELQDNVRAIIGDEMLQLMPQGEATAAVTWSGSAAIMIDENENLTYSIPSEGSNIFLDNIVIPKTSENTQGAYDFINFMLDAEIAAQNTDWVGYSTPNSAAMELIDYEITSDERFYPSDEVIDNLEYYQYLGDLYTQKYNDLFLEFKMY